MMELNITVPGKKTTEKVSLSDDIFAQDFNEPLIHQVVTATLAGRRAGTSAQKTRSEVRGGGKKPWRQKGTGRARAGTIRSPLWRGGGVTFASKTRDYSQKINKKMYRAAIKSILSELIRQDRMVILAELAIDEPKTKKMLALLKQLDLNKVLFITDEVTENLYLSARNIPNIEVRDVQGIDPVSLIKFDKVVFTVPALKQIEEKLV